MKKYKYSYFKNYILRVPAKPFNPDLFRNIDLEDVRRIFLSDMIFQEAVFLASKNLFDEATNTIIQKKLYRKIQVMTSLVCCYHTYSI